MTAILYCTKRHLPFHSHGVRVSCVSERVNIDSIIRILDLANSRGLLRGCLLCARTHRFKGSRLPLPLCVRLCCRFAASPCAAEAKEHCSHSAYVPHNGAHRTITSRGAELRSRKTKPLSCRQHTPVAIHAPARSFRGYGGIETPMFLVLLSHKRTPPPTLIVTDVKAAAFCAHPPHCTMA